MQDQPIYKREYNRERQHTCEEQVKFIENSLIQLVQMIQYYLEEAWYLRNLRTQFHFSWYYHEGIRFNSLHELKTCLTDAAKHLLKYEKRLEQEGTISIVFVQKT